MQGREHKVPGKGSPDRNLGSFEITNLTEHHNIWVGTQDGTEPTCKSQTNLTFNRDLHHALQLVLDWILNRYNPGIRGI